MQPISPYATPPIPAPDPAPASAPQDQPPPINRPDSRSSSPPIGPHPLQVRFRSKTPEPAPCFIENFPCTFTTAKGSAYEVKRRVVTHNRSTVPGNPEITSKNMFFCTTTLANGIVGWLNQGLTPIKMEKDDLDPNLFRLVFQDKDGRERGTFVSHRPDFGPVPCKPEAHPVDVFLKPDGKLDFDAADRQGKKVLHIGNVITEFEPTQE